MFFWDHHSRTNLPQRSSVFVHHCMELFLQRGDEKGLTCEIWDEIAMPSSSQSSSSKGVVVMWWDSVRDTISSTTPPATASSDTSPASCFRQKNWKPFGKEDIFFSHVKSDEWQCWETMLKYISEASPTLRSKVGNLGKNPGINTLLNLAPTGYSLYKTLNEKS